MPLESFPPSLICAIYNTIQKVKYLTKVQVKASHLNYLLGSCWDLNLNRIKYGKPIFCSFKSKPLFSSWSSITECNAPSFVTDADEHWVHSLGSEHPAKPADTDRPRALRNDYGLSRHNCQNPTWTRRVDERSQRGFSCFLFGFLKWQLFINVLSPSIASVNIG